MVKAGKIVGVDEDVVMVRHAPGAGAKGAPVLGHLWAPLAMRGG